MKQATLSAAGQTDTGCTRQHNEDSFLIELQQGLFLVADGMGGYRNGAVASRAACQLFAQSHHQNAGDPSEQMRQIIQEVNLALYTQGTARGEEMRMGTTFLAAVLVGDHLHLCHLGDVRAYLYREGSLRQLTRDHSTVADMVALGFLTPQEALAHPMRHLVNRCLGLEEEAAPDCQELALEQGDRILLCSDGLWNEVPDPELQLLLGGTGTLEEVVASLVSRAREQGGHDNITAVLLQVEAPRTSARTSPRRPPGKRAQAKSSKKRERRKR